MRAFLPRFRHSRSRHIDSRHIDSSSAPRRRDDQGAVLPSPVVLLSVAAVAVAAVAFFMTGDDEPAERDITPVAEAPSATTSPSPTKSPKAEATKKPKPKPKPIQREKTYVVVFNNSGISGLAGEVSGQAASAGWNVVGADNWYGTIPDNTVYYPGGMQRAAEQLALDLGIDRVNPAVDPMQMDRLTVILTGPVG